MEFPVSDSGRVHRDSETGATGLPKSENLGAGTADTSVWVFWHFRQDVNRAR